MENQIQAHLKKKKLLPENPREGWVRYETRFRKGIYWKELDSVGLI